MRGTATRLSAPRSYRPTPAGRSGSSRVSKGGEWRASGGGYQLLYPGSGFDLAFDVAITPETRADLVLGGLARGPKRLAPVTLRLARYAGRSYDRLYWLEAIGYVLSAAAYAR